MEYVWEWFREVFNFERMTFTELHHWSVVTGKPLKGAEAELIMSLDRAYWVIYYDKR